MKKKHNCYGFMNNKLSALRNVLLKALNDSFSIFCVFLFVWRKERVFKNKYTPVELSILFY